MSAYTVKIEEEVLTNGDTMKTEFYNRSFFPRDLNKRCYTRLYKTVRLYSSSGVYYNFFDMPATEEEAKRLRDEVADI